jgi:hypothetical protein
VGTREEGAAVGAAVGQGLMKSQPSAGQVVFLTTVMLSMKTALQK